MARYSQEQKALSREKLLAAAGRKFRESGYHGVGVDGLAAAAQQTSGAFYTHFESKEAVFQEVLRQSFQDLTERFVQASSKDKLSQEYVSTPHVENASGGCALPALSADVGRSSQGTRQLYQQCLLELLAETGCADRQAAMQQLSMMVGAVVLARALPEGEIREELLLAARRQLGQA